MTISGEKSPPPAAVFMFSVDRLEEVALGGYDGPALKALFWGLLEVDEGAEFQVLLGDLLLHNLAYKVAKVTLSGKSSEWGFDGVSTRSEGDLDLFQTLIWDFCDAIADRWHSLDLGALPAVLGHRDVFVVALSALDKDLRKKVDASLRGHRFYLGAFEVDPGNPVQQRVTGRGLVHACDYRSRSLFFSRWESEEPLDPPPLVQHGEEWFVGLPFAEVRYHEEEELWEEREEKVPGWPEAPLSPRGEKSAALIEARRDQGHLGRLASEAQSLKVERDTPPFEISVEAMRSAADAIVADEKLLGYALDADHEQGGAEKARWFRAALGIGREDWRHLASQLKLGLHEAPEIESLRSTEWGLRYKVRTTVRGLNGASAIVVSIWQVEPGEPPKFITVFPGKKREEPGEAPPALALPASLKGGERWAALWEIAHGHAEEAAARAVPTPLRVAGAWYVAGAFGTASIGVSDARRGFARWLKQEGKAHLERGRGAVVPARRSMFDEAVAYAGSFAEVLKLNGIEAEVRSRQN
jgi:hypothetical protein